MIDGLASWFAERSQVDVGNLAVGVGTVMVALATYRSIAQLGRNELARARKEWVDELRQEIAVFIQSYESIAAKLSQSGTGETSFRAWADENDENQSKYDEMMRSKYRIALMLNSEKDEHRRLLESMQKLLSDNQHDRPENFVEIAGEVCRNEWEKAKGHLK